MTGPLIPPRFGARQAQPLENFLDQSRRVDLDAMLDKLGAGPDQVAALQRDRDQVTSQAREIAEKYPAFVEWLMDVSLRRPAVLFGLGDERDFYIAFREGENALAWRVLQAIAEGRGESIPHRDGV